MTLRDLSENQMLAYQKECDDALFTWFERTHLGGIRGIRTPALTPGVQAAWRAAWSEATKVMLRDYDTIKRNSKSII